LHESVPATEEGVMFDVVVGKKTNRQKVVIF